MKNELKFQVKKTRSLSLRFRRGTGFGKALRLVCGMWLAINVLVYAVSASFAPTCLILTSTLFIITVFFLHSKTLIIATLDADVNPAVLHLDGHLVPLCWQNFTWSLKTNPQNYFFPNSLVAEQKTAHAHFVLEQPLTRNKIKLFNALPEISAFDPRQTYHYQAQAQSLLNLIHLLDAEFLDTLLLTEDHRAKRLHNSVAR